jgi:hypothetical protein
MCNLISYHIFPNKIEDSILYADVFVCTFPNRKAPAYAAINQEGPSSGSRQPKASFLSHSVPWLLDSVAGESGCISSNGPQTRDGAYLSRKRCTPDECRVPSSKPKIS